MTLQQAIDGVADFLRKQVCPQIQLKKASDENIRHWELVNPAVFEIYMPLTEMTDESELTAPSITIIPKECTEENGAFLCPIQLAITTWDPGEITGTGVEDAQIQRRTTAAWRAMDNLAETIHRAIRRQRSIAGGVVDGKIQRGTYAMRDAMPDTDAYSIGWLDFTLRGVLETEEQDEDWEG